MRSCVCYCCGSTMVAKFMDNITSIVSTKRGAAPSISLVPHGATTSRVRGVRASMVDSYESSSDFVKRMEQAWLISQVNSLFIYLLKKKHISLLFFSSLNSWGFSLLFKF